MGSSPIRSQSKQVIWGFHKCTHGEALGLEIGCSEGWVMVPRYVVSQLILFGPDLSEYGGKAPPAHNVVGIHEKD